MALSKYARRIDSSWRYQMGCKGYTGIYLKTYETCFNDLLKARGYVFLRDIYETLGFPISKESCVSGWSRGDCIKFLITNSDDIENSDVFLDFNVSGNILNEFE